MGFIVAAVVSIVSTVGSFVAGLGVLGQALVAIGLNVAVGYINKKLSKKKEEQAGGVQFEREYGADVSRKVLMGYVGMAGHDCYVNTYGKANNNLQQIYAVSDYYCTALSRVAINGEYVSLAATPDPQKGYAVTSGDFANLIFVKFHDGFQTVADPFLVANAYPAERWTADHVGLGISYITVYMEYDQDKNNSFPDFFFEIAGAPLYDWRFDSTNGGSGPQRHGDVSTHVFTENPIVMEYNYRRGLSVNGDMFCGMGMSARDLPVDKYTTAANLCDEIKVDTLPAYRCSIMVDCMQTHGTTIEAFATSCGALHIDGAAGSYPIVGSAQPTVVTITDRDLVTGESVRFRAKRSMSELINTVSGNFPNPDELWSMVGYEPQISTAAVALDRRTRDVNIDFPQVRHARQAAQLAWIYLYENRFEATATVTLRPRFRGLEAGDWIRWNSEAYGDRVYIVTESSLNSLDADKPRSIVLTLQERDGSIYDNVTPPLIILPFPPGMPQYLQEVENFTVVPIYLMADNGALRPAIRAAWSAIDDTTVSDVLVRYWPETQPENNVIVNANGRIVVPLVDGVVGETDYMVQTKLVTDPLRPTSWSAPERVTTFAGSEDGPVDYDGLTEDVQDLLTRVTSDLRDLISWSQEFQSNYSDLQFQNYVDRQTLRREVTSTVGTASARFTEEITAATGPNSAIVQSLTQLQAQIAGKADADIVELLQTRVDVQGDAITAIANAVLQVNASYDGNVSSGALRMTAEAGTGGFTTNISFYARAGTANAFLQAGMFIRVSPTQSQIMFIATQFVIFNSQTGEGVAPFVVQNNRVYMQGADIGDLRFRRMRSDNGKLELVGEGNSAYIRMFV